MIVHLSKCFLILSLLISFSAWTADSVSLQAQQEFLGLINQYRASRGLPQLTLNLRLQNAADLQATDMATHDFISHKGSNGSDLGQRVGSTGYRYRTVGENLGVGQSDTQDIFRSWVLSEGHNRNMLMPGAREMGLVLAQNPRARFKKYWALVLGASL